MVFKSAGDRKDLYRVVLKKAILDNIESLKLMEQGQLITSVKAISEHLNTERLRPGNHYGDQITKKNSTFSLNSIQID